MWRYVLNVPSFRARPRPPNAMLQSSTMYMCPMELSEADGTICPTPRPRPSVRRPRRVSPVHVPEQQRQRGQENRGARTVVSNWFQVLLKKSRNKMLEDNFVPYSNSHSMRCLNFACPQSGHFPLKPAARSDSRRQLKSSAIFAIRDFVGGVSEWSGRRVECFCRKIRIKCRKECWSQWIT